MSLRLEMLRAVSLSRNQLEESTVLVGEFLRSQISPDGGFCNRSGSSDLYYTVFGLESLIALGEPVPSEVLPYLGRAGLGESLDLVHLCCLIRCRASAGILTDPSVAESLLAHLERFRTRDGGYNPEPGAAAASAYGCFLVAMAYEDLGMQIPLKDRIIHCLKQLRAADNGYANQPKQPLGLTPSTAATATLLASLGEPYPPGLEAWLLSRCHPAGGFFATPAAPIPDLLSTATAIHALACMRADLDGVREPCLDFIQSLWNGEGAFVGNWADTRPDCEYTYYGLLALGHLSL